MRIGRHTLRFIHIARNTRNCVYLAELTNGLVKVGFTNSPRQRLTNLARQWHRESAEIARFELFIGDQHAKGHYDPQGNEARAIKALSQIAPAVVGRVEYFPIPYETALAVVAATQEI